MSTITMESQGLPPIRACLFDMDGLLINSEDLYTLVVNKILHEYGKPSLPWSIKAQLQGRPMPEAANIFHEWARLPISHAEYITKLSALQLQHFPTTEPLPGALDLVKSLAKTANTKNPVHIALATSSHSRNYTLKTAHLDELFSQFPSSRIILGDDPRIGHGRGKPRPDIYLLALEVINKELRESRCGEPEIKPEECLVFEDSVPGVEAGRRAGMRVVWCPHEGLLKEYSERIEEVLAGSTGEHKDLDSIDGVINGVIGTEPWRAVGAGKPGLIGDGWGQLLQSLEVFPYEKYGIQAPAI
ncbi:hypothetical protein D8B26_002665 [Coccidioides posadasii str. Silveira]|uniref:HAD superfamily hydrolase n=3 Tax=Coccidioides posadasii TaxID=199306 RepID=E9CYP8_COCPS|nr:2-deoxyglucose-6-phosphate phosphatase, putative [Coccidioides posadasii C735 delta SOWgp]EER27035.1 2-deoxyglucose-6-phosphate phosphatase, putative [Coccidioides posadasii C735 delta SOWgp]EFW21075.1 HAD superfamily hydrolase [Coccidioides posadasii str. Silveira]KMM66711.1 HAD-superfamily hydrolase subfamily IA [Coccidioides posadasii RMSCC 3488]QVM07968.1 hypothetical protein D8B26_002665 [Coccidioides posadasii str. Silveira]|eukprot:XP_003069180.1 2-deoxyglucose-6-phosphate phosphatase, putative [Coccidioides posadasii C735 delta SOWgp]